MNTNICKSICASALLAWLAIANPVFAQGQPQQSQQQQTQQPQQPQQTTGLPALTAEQLAALDVRASELIGKDVKSPAGEDLGSIADLVLDVERARVRYVVVSYGGVLGLGSRLAAFPPSMFRPGPEEGALLLDAGRDELEQAPSFESKLWPDWNRGSYRSQVDQFFYQRDEVLRTPAGGRLTRASDVIGKGVNDGGGRDAGSMEDMVVNLGNGQIRYAVLNFGRAWSLDNKLVALPLNAFRFPTRPDLKIFLVLSRDRVDMARAFDPDDWPDLSSVRQREDMDAYLSRFSEGAPSSGQSGSGTGGGNRGGANGASD